MSAQKFLFVSPEALAVDLAWKVLREGKVKQILIPNMFYRTDIGERRREDGDRLQAWGYV